MLPSLPVPSSCPTSHSQHSLTVSDVYAGCSVDRKTSEGSSLGFVVYCLGREHLPAGKEIMGFNPIPPASSMTCWVLAFGEGKLLRGRAYWEQEQYRFGGGGVRVREG